MLTVDLIFGFLLVFAGRNLFWLCVGVVGFLVGVQCSEALGFSDGWVAILTALALGCLGALLAISFEWLMVVFGVGFLGGGYLFMHVFPLTAHEDPYSWLIFVIGGIIGTCLMVIIFDWTLILISALLGTTLIVNVFHTTDGLRGVLFIGIMMTGILAQYLTLRETSGGKGHDAH